MEHFKKIRSALKRFIPSWALGFVVFRIYRPIFEGWLRICCNDYSQFGETRIIRQIFKGKTTGMFVEIGANDGRTVSSTLGLVRDGWSGISVEPNPSTFKRLSQNLLDFPAVRLVNAAIAPTRGKVRLFLSRDDPFGLYATIATESSGWLGDLRTGESVEVLALPLADLLAVEKAPAYFELLLIDCEGMDLDVLKTLDIDLHRPHLIVTEDDPPKDHEKAELMKAWGYKYNCNVGCNSFWIDASSSGVS
jgi:FkbM family methyltransferase